MVEGTPLLRVQTGNRLEGSNPFVSATCPSKSVLTIQLRHDLCLVFVGYAGWAEHWNGRRDAKKWSLPAEILQTS